MTFVSIVGTQVMAVLNPLLALAAEGKKPASVVLMTTTNKLSMELAERLKDFLIGPRFPYQPAYLPDQIDIRPIVIIRREPDSPPTCAEVLADITASDKVLLNIAGGMNFQIAAMLAVAPREGLTLIYPEMTGVHLYSLAEGALRSRLLPLPTPVDVLTLQGFHPDKATGTVGNFLTDIMKKCNLKFPPNALRGVRVGGVLFDLLWNTGNEIRLLICVHGKDWNGDEIRDLCRSLMAIAANRSTLGELFHRSITVVTDQPRAFSRLQREGQRKLIPLFWRDTTFGRAGFKNLWHRSGELANSPASNQPVILPPISMSRLLLVTPLGKDLTPTLIAIYTHRPDILLLPYTPGIAEIDRHRQALEDHAVLLPVANIHFVPIRFDCRDLLEKLPVPPEGVTVEVNLTPGTKAQTALLSWWGQRVGAALFTLNNQRGEAQQIGGDCAYPCVAPSPIDLLTLSGHRINSSAWVTRKGNTPVDDRWLQDNRESLQALAILLTEVADQQPGQLKTILGQEVVTTAGTCGATIDNDFVLKSSDGKSFSFSRKNDIWFEDLLGMQLRRSGADNVYLRLETRWGDDEENRDIVKYQEVSPLSEVDVTARFGTNYLVISCKSGKGGSKLAISTEAMAYAALFGRYARPVVAYLRHQGEPKRHAITGVWEMGPATFADADRLRDFAQRVFRESQTTA